MSLELNLINTEKGKKNMTKFNKSREIHKKTKIFSDLVWEGKKKEALNYFNKLDTETQHYIQLHENYKYDLKCASFGGI